jgi:hypothetical protein
MSMNKEYAKKYNPKYYSKHRLSEIEKTIDWQWELKQIALFLYSKGTMKCKICGFNNIDCLELDHINNDGYKWRKENPNFSKNPYFHIRKLEYPVDYQVLCRNCNWQKHLNNLDKNKEEK